MEIKREDIEKYYITENHNKSECLDYFGLSNKKFSNLLKEFNIQKSRSLIMKNAKRRTHESYVLAGKKSADAQKAKWQQMSNDDKSIWAEQCKQIQLNLPDDVKQNKIQKFKQTYNSFTNIKKDKINKQRSESCKKYWNSLNPSSYQNKIEQQLLKTKQVCLEKYGVEFTCMRQEARLHGNNSTPNKEFKQLLINNNLYINDSESSEFSLENKSYDFKVGKNLIEINPTYTHSISINPFNRNPISKDYHFNKSKIAKDNGFRCIHIWDWDDKNKIIQLLKSRDLIYARKCVIKEVSKHDAIIYLNKYHLQGYANDSIRIGLYFNNQLVSIMTFGKPRYNNNYEYELIRYCSNYSIVGGVEKLFKYFLVNYSPNSIISYCDMSKFTGDTYLKLGFKFKSCSISRHWYNIKTKQHITDNLLRQRGFDQLFNTSYGKGTSNEQLMLDNGFVEIYDAGQAVYEYIKD